MIEVQRFDYIRVPVTDMEKANHFYGELLGLPRNPHLQHEDWVEYEVGNVTLAVMTPHTHDYEFTALPPGTLAFRVPTFAEAKAKLEEAGVEVNEMWDSGVCQGAGVRDPDGNAILLHHRYKPYEEKPDRSGPGQAVPGPRAARAATARTPRMPVSGSGVASFALAP